VVTAECQQVAKNVARDLLSKAQGVLYDVIFLRRKKTEEEIMARYFITGATGFVGSHLAETCVRRGHPVVTLARPQSDTAFLEKLGQPGVQIIRGDLTDEAALRAAVDQAGVVVHCAAKVGDWGPVEEYRSVNVEGLRGLLEAVHNRPLQRFVHLSSLGVYEARDHFGTDESVPPPERHIDGYTQTKVESEKLALQYHREHGVPVVVLRPGFIYGPRDRTVLPKLMKALEEKQVRYLGSGEQAMNTIFVGNLVDAIFLAVEKPNAVGQVYNLTDDERVSKKRFLESIADLAGVERPQKHVPLWLAKGLAKMMEGVARWRNVPQPPKLTQARIKFLGLNLGFSVEKAKRELGYQPRVKFEEGIEEAVGWWKTVQGSANERTPALQESRNLGNTE
jgi:nucleoside-diphosphate-sugar epimerase